MLVPIKNNIFELIEMKSKFIAITIPFNNIDDFSKIMSDIKKEYYEAKHFLFAYSTNGKMKCDNDGEPGNIAKRILDLFSLIKVDDILVVVVRYFGGVKLGASNLLRAYVNAASESIKRAEKGNKIDMYLYSIKCDYATFNKIKRFRYKIENVKYLDKISLDIISKENILNNLQEYKGIEVEYKIVNRVDYD